VYIKLYISPLFWKIGVARVFFVEREKLPPPTKDRVFFLSIV